MQKNIATLLFSIALSGCAAINQAEYIPKKVSFCQRPYVERRAEQEAAKGNHGTATRLYCDLGKYNEAKKQLELWKKQNPNDFFIFQYENFLRKK